MPKSATLFRSQQTVIKKERKRPPSFQKKISGFIEGTDFFGDEFSLNVGDGDTSVGSKIGAVVTFLSLFLL